MQLSQRITLRAASPSDALCLSALATQVFFDTYATSGMNSDLAEEAQLHYSVNVYAERLAVEATRIFVAEAEGNLAGFVDIQMVNTCPIATLVGPEVLRLYIQAPFQRQGLGTTLLSHAERVSEAEGARTIWLAAWVGNAPALAFYSRAGYRKEGTMQYVINGKGYENHVLAKRLRNP